MLRLLLFICIYVTTIFNISSQGRWSKNYLEGENPYGENHVEHYDKGYLLAGRYGPNYPEYCWLIKTDIDGNEIWKKVIGVESQNIVITADIAYNENGDIFLVGSTSFYNENDYDPLIMKLNACGEKEWCKVFYEVGLNFSNEVVATPDQGCVIVLRYMNTNLQKDRICLAKFNSVGDMQWKQCYNSLDTNIYNEDAQNLITTPDNGFLMTGYCDYIDPNPPHYWYYKPYYIKTDSLGNFEWETVVHKELSDKGGLAWTTTIDPDSNYFYSSISHEYKLSSIKYAPALLKMDFSGNVIDIYDLAPPNRFGTMIEAKFISDTTLAASVYSGPENTHPKAVIIDTLGNILKQKELLQNKRLAMLEVTFDKKLLYFVNMLDEQEEFDTYLFKLNQNLLSDSIYTQPFVYDSLCPYPIVSDTIVQDDCGLIVGMEEIYTPKNESENKVLIYPNPANSQFKVQSPMFEVGGCTLEIYDLFGRKVEEIQVPKGQLKVEVNTVRWKRGLYVVRVIGKDGMIRNGKVVVR